MIYECVENLFYVFLSMGVEHQSVRDAGELACQPGDAKSKQGSFTVILLWKQLQEKTLPRVAGTVPTLQPRMNQNVLGGQCCCCCVAIH